MVEEARVEDLSLKQYMMLERLYKENPQKYKDCVAKNLPKYLPVVYTPTIGTICEMFTTLSTTEEGLIGHDGLIIRPYQKGWLEDFRKVLKVKRPQVVVLTDGSRILGLGDLGINGLPISIGKCRVYQLLGDIERVLPILVDTGTDREDYHSNPYYDGLKMNRTDGEKYCEGVMDMIMAQLKIECPLCVIQFEDIALPRCTTWLHRYKNEYLTFNDDIQGTAAVVLSGLINVERLLKKQPKVLIVGAGSSAIGVAQMWSRSKYGSKQNLWMIDSKGLLTNDRSGQVSESKREFLREKKDINTESLESIVSSIQPDVLIGLSATGNLFTEQVIGALPSQCVVMSLSNPTNCSECSPDVVFRLQKKAYYASGTAYASYPYNQANNMFIFPVIGALAIKHDLKCIEDSLFVKVAEKLAALVLDEDLLGKNKMLYPSVSKLKETCEQIINLL